MVSKKLFSAMVAALVILSTVAVSSVAFAQAQTTTAAAKPTQTITQIAENNKNLTTLVSLLKKGKLQNTTLTDTLSGPGNYTLFAPDNAAFAKLNPSALANLQNNTTALTTLLLYHVVPTKVSATNLTSNGPLSSGNLTTLNSLSLPYSVNGAIVKVENATVTKADINATNGVIHVIDSVLVPPSNTTATASPTASGGFLGLPGFEVVYAVTGLLVVAYLVARRKQ